VLNVLKEELLHLLVDVLLECTKMLITNNVNNVIMSVKPVPPPLLVPFAEETELQLPNVHVLKATSKLSKHNVQNVPTNVPIVPMAKKIVLLVPKTENTPQYVPAHKDITTSKTNPIVQFVNKNVNPVSLPVTTVSNVPPVL